MYLRDGYNSLVDHLIFKQKLGQLCGFPGARRADDDTMLILTNGCDQDIFVSPNRQ